MLVYRYNEQSKYYLYAQNANRDPLESEIKGYDVWLLPANCTFQQPPEAKDGYNIKWNGEGWEYGEIPVEPEPPEITLDEVKANKIASLKDERDAEEENPLEVNGCIFDFDAKARERINAALIVLQATKGVLTWTLADNSETEVNAEALLGVVIAAGVRSNELHTRYRIAKEAVEAAETVEEIEAVVL